MPTVYFSTDINPEILSSDTNNIEYFMKLIIAEASECLNSNGINYVSENNGSLYDLNSEDTQNKPVRITLSMQSSPGPIPSQTAGVMILFTPGDPQSKRLAIILSNSFGSIYTDPSLVKIISMEQNQASGQNPIPTVNLRIGYADNADDILWIRENIEEIAASLVRSLSEYFGIPFTQCKKSDLGIINQDTNLVQKPSINSNIIESLATNTKIKIYGQWEDWYIVDHNHNLGYVQTKFITT